MAEDWQYQLRIYLGDALAEAARHAPADPALASLNQVLRQHDAALVGQFDAFTAYVAEAEREGTEKYPLYAWTKATIDDPAKAARHRRAFAVRINGAEVYPKAEADALEAALAPLVDGEMIIRLSRHDTNPANNLQVPEEYRQDYR